MAEQTINLYLKLGVQTKGYKSAKLGGLAVAILAFGFVVATGYLAYRNASLNESLVSLARDNQQLQAQIAAASQSQGAALAELRETLSDVQRQRQGKARLLQVLARADTGDRQGFSEVLLGLARQHEEGITLSRIEVRERGADFLMSGSVKQASAIPDFLLRLGGESAFSGMAFGKVKFTEAAPNTDFEVRSWSLAEDGS
jgi:ribosomal protein L17